MPQKDPWIMFCFLIQYEMEWKPIWSESGARSMRPRGKPGLSPNHSAFWGVRGKLNFLTWEHPKNCIYVTWVMKRPNGIREGFYHQNGIRHWTSSPEMSIWEQGSSLLNQLWFIQENWKMKWANFQLFFPFFCMSHLFRSISLALKVRFSGPVPQVNAIICLCVSQAWN